MTNIAKGMAAGLAAMVVLSMLMLMKAAMGLMPELDPIGMISNMLGAERVVGWVMHFLIGTVLWGGLFAWLDPHLPSHSHWLKGVIFGLGAWLIMMVAMMPMAGKGLFGMELGLMAPLMTMMLHVIFGAVLGAVYGMLLGKNRDRHLHMETVSRPSR